MLLDVDEFKDINDSYGHLLGDLLLQQLAGVLRAGIRSSDMAIRYGGDEFVMVLPHADMAEATRLAERLRIAVESTPMGSPGNPCRR